jgi:hypothetical protein
MKIMASLFILVIAIINIAAFDLDVPQRTPRCENGRSDRVFFIHNRKAGGTTVRHFLGEQQHCRSPQLFRGFVEESTVFNVTRLKEPGTVFITVLREPIISSYHFEGKGSFGEWVAAVQRDRKRGRPNFIWMEVQNYYVQRLSGYRWHGAGPKWPTGLAKEDKTAPQWDALYKRAISVLQKMDIVFVMDFFPELGLGHSRPRSLGVRASDKPGHKIIITPAELDTLKEWNQWDSLLYAEARKIAVTQLSAFGLGNYNTKVNASSHSGRTVVGAQIMLDSMLLEGKSDNANDIEKKVYTSLLSKSSCARDITSKWGEPIARLKGKVNCRNLRQVHSGTRLQSTG